MSAADGWATGDPAKEPLQARAHFNISNYIMLDLQVKIEMVNMLRITGGPVRRRPQRPIPTRSFLDDPYDPNRGVNNQVIIDTVEAYYVDNGQVSDSPATDSLLVYLHLHSYSDNYSGNVRNQPAFRDEAALFCALGWYVRGNETLRQFSKARIDVRLGNHHLMRVLFIIERTYGSCLCHKRQRLSAVH